MPQPLRIGLIGCGAISGAYLDHSRAFPILQYTACSDIDIDEATIGRPVAFTAFMMCPGHEHWHPNPHFFYESGGGPMFDMGPYYLTALLNFFGPIRRITGAASIAIPERRTLAGTTIDVQTPDHICGTIEFKN